MKHALRSIYAALPFKQQLFTILRLLPLPESLYKHLHFKGIIDVKVSDTERFRMKHHGYIIENELFWRGMQGWEKVSLELWVRLCRRSSVIFDIGANTGVYALIAHTVKKDATIIAVEPVQRVFNLLDENLKLNNADVRALCAAISDHDGTATLYDEVDNPYITSVSLNRDFEPNTERFRPVEVPCRTISGIMAEMNLGKLDLLKIDVETHEPEVLAGSADILRRDRPTMLIEILNDQ
ncbi:MAG: FkbM family methyltransferase, partial [Flavobacteriales bacterium]|nr:FkbM family methyltransferase [Flavobacteriales bacterium]